MCISFCKIDCVQAFSAVFIWKKGPADIGEAVDNAVKAGYRHFDCALLYENEEDVGNALNSLIAQKYVTREELFVTTKVSHMRDLCGRETGVWLNLYFDS